VIFDRKPQVFPLKFSLPLVMRTKNEKLLFRKL
jgi:hypothetical protein